MFWDRWPNLSILWVTAKSLRSADDMLLSTVSWTHSGIVFEGHPSSLCQNYTLLINKEKEPSLEYRLCLSRSSLVLWPSQMLLFQMPHRSSGPPIVVFTIFLNVSNLMIYTGHVFFLGDCKTHDGSSTWCKDGVQKCVQNVCWETRWKEPLQRSRGRWNDNIKVVPKEIVCDNGI
jgi:hypothetical protein